jgi:hypothetical protein
LSVLKATLMRWRVKIATALKDNKRVISDSRGVGNTEYTRLPRLLLGRQRRQCGALFDIF